MVAVSVFFSPRPISTKKETHTPLRRRRRDEGGTCVRKGKKNKIFGKAKISFLRKQKKVLKFRPFLLTKHIHFFSPLFSGDLSGNATTVPPLSFAPPPASICPLPLSSHPPICLRHIFHARQVTGRKPKMYLAPL